MSCPVSALDLIVNKNANKVKISYNSAGEVVEIDWWNVSNSEQVIHVTPVSGDTTATDTEIYYKEGITA